MREVCCSIVFTVVFRLLFVFFIFMFGVVGATLGASAGAVIGWNNNRRLMKGMITGAVSGTTLSYKFIKAIHDHLHSKYNYDDKLVSVVHPVKLIAKDLVKMLRRRRDERNIMGFSKIVQVLNRFFEKYFNISGTILSTPTAHHHHHTQYISPIATPTAAPAN